MCGRVDLRVQVRYYGLNHRQEVITESGEVRKNILYTIKCGIVTYALRVLSLRETTVCKVKFTTSTTYVRR